MAYWWLYQAGRVERFKYSPLSQTLGRQDGKNKKETASKNFLVVPNKEDTFRWDYTTLRTRYGFPEVSVKQLLSCIYDILTRWLIFANNLRNIGKKVSRNKLVPIIHIYDVVRKQVIINSFKAMSVRYF